MIETNATHKSNGKSNNSDVHTLPSSTVRTLAAKLREHEDSSALCITGLTHTSIRVFESALSESCVRAAVGGVIGRERVSRLYQRIRSGCDECYRVLTCATIGHAFWHFLGQSI